MTRIAAVLLATIILCLPTAVFAQGQEALETMQGTVKVGDKAPAFTLKDQNGQEHSLENLLDADGLLALVFYRSADW